MKIIPIPLKTALLGKILISAYASLAFGQSNVSMSVNWRADLKENDASTYQVNIWDGVSSVTSANSTYQSRLSDWNLGMTRVHGFEMYSTSNSSKRWIDYTTETWDEAKIVSIYNGIRPNIGEVMQNIPNWPSWMDTNSDGKLDTGTGGNGSTDMRDAYADWCADLVRILNIDNDFDVQYWEVINEIESKYSWGGDANMAEIYNRCAVAMKAVDPNIKIGGPALTQPWPSSTEENNLNSWIGAVKSNLDFFSFHNYGTGGYNPSSDLVHDRALNSTSRASWIRGLLNSQSVSSDVPIYLGESNIFFTWTVDQTTKYMRSILGGNFVALAIKSAGENKYLQAIQFWNDRDGTYGFLKSDSSYTYRATGHVLKLANEHLVGTSVGVSTANKNQLNLYAVKNEADNKKAILLVNTSDIAASSGPGLLPGTDYNASISFSYDWIPTNSSYTIYTISETSSDTASVSSSTATYSSGTLTVSVPARTIKMVVFEDQTPANQIVLTPEADTYVYDSSASTNYGSETRLWVYGKPGHNRETYYRYNLSGLGGSITSAKLRLYPRIINGTATHSVDVLNSTSWDEFTVNWNNRPSATGSSLGSWTPASGGEYEVDVTAAVQAAGSDIGFRLTSDKGVDIRYGSREGERQFQPDLVLTVQPGGSTYHIYSESGNEFASEGGTISGYKTSSSTQTSGAPEGSEYKRVTDTDHYAAYNFNMPGSNADKSAWAGANLVFRVRPISGSTWQIGLRDASGTQKRYNISSYVSNNGTWQTAVIPIADFTSSGVDLSQLQKIFFYHPWASSQALDFDDVKVVINGSPASNDYHFFSESGDEFGDENGTISFWKVASSIQTVGAPEGSEYRRITDTNHYASYKYVMPGGSADKSNWAGKSLVFQARTSGSWSVTMKDARGTNLRISLGTYITTNGIWQTATVPLTDFTSNNGIDLSQLESVGFYHLWTSGQDLDFDDIKIVGGN